MRLYQTFTIWGLGEHFNSLRRLNTPKIKASTPGTWIDFRKCEKRHRRLNQG